MSGTRGPAGAREPVGSAADEAARLADALQAWWARRDHDGTEQHDEQRADHSDEHGDEQRDEHADEHADEHGHEPGEPSACRYCPLCRGISVAQSLRPEVVQHLLSAAESLAAALRELARDDEPGRPHPGPASARTSSPRTVPIPVDDGADGADHADHDADQDEPQEAH